MDPKRQIPLPGSSPDEMFPVLTPEQQARVLAHGSVRKVVPSETLVELNQQPTKIFVVVQGKLELFRFKDQHEEVIAVCGHGMFTGELNVLSGRRGLVSIRAAEAGELIEIERDALRALVQTDSELSDIFLRAFILRRLELIARGIGDVVLIGSSHSLDTFRIKDFLTP
jgi:thioredoxin reductase (NADPH)